MREILFKGKSVDNNKWVYGTGIVNVKVNTHDKNKKEIIQEVNYDELYYLMPSYETEKVIPETICQYTGLEDKNGKKIFEGDICKGNQYSDKDNLFVIKYGKYKTKDWKDKYISNTYQFGWYAEFIESKEQVHLVIPNGIEVIGNIFDEKE